jgi:trans-2,3-dihydro-3-hydroxyanthranilate isomerase
MSETIERLAAFDPFAEVEPGGEAAAPRRYLLLDVFAARPLEGNQLAVFTDGRDIEAPRMQAVALELKLSETVFLLPPQEGGDARVRIFTPTAELPFAGHPVLGAAAVLAGALGRRSVVLETGSGPASIVFERSGGRAATGSMSQPLPSREEFARPAELLKALGVVRSELPIEVYRNGPRHLYVQLPSFEAVSALDPDLRALARVAGEIGVSCFAGSQGRFKSRMFAPGLGVAEDPATGSAAGPLAVHLVRHGLAGPGEEIEISQGAEIGRPSLLRARVDGTGETVEAVRVGGEVVMLARGEMWLP